MNGYVSALRAIVITHRLLVRQLVTRGRIAALTGVGIIVSLIVAIVSRAAGDDVYIEGVYQQSANSSTNTEVVIEPIEVALELGVELMANLGFTIVVPIVALVFASAAFGDLKEDSTLVYLWLRPMDRWPMVVGAWLASVTVSLPVTLVPLTVAALVADVGSELVWATALACVVGNLAYSAMFVVLGLLTKNAVVWGIGYILVWEGLVAGISSVGARLAIRGYTRSIIADQTGIDLSLGDLSLGSAIVVPALAVVAALVLSTWRLRALDVA